MPTHPRFWSELAERLGPPIFGATLVACLLELRFDPTHLALLLLGFGLIAGSHWWRLHRPAAPLGGEVERSLPPDSS